MFASCNVDLGIPFFSFCDCLQLLHVHQVLVAAGSELVFNECVPAEKIYRPVAEFSRHAARPRFLKTDARDRRQDVDSVWRAAQLKKAVRRDQIFPLHSQASEAEGVQHAKNAVCILGRCSNEEVDIARQSRVAMERDGVATDDDVLNSVSSVIRQTRSNRCAASPRDSV